jgi:hypothetical protein
MSGVIPDSIITVSMPALPYGYTTPYRMISFPSRVKVLGVSFTVDALAAGNPENERVFTLSVMKGCKARDAGAGSDDEDYVVFFGDAPKPVVTVATSKFLSTIAEPVLKAEWTTWGETYTADVAQMDTDEYLTVFVYGDTEGDYDDLTDNDTWQDTSCTISISYTGATNYG